MLRSDIAKRKNTDPSEVRTCDLHIRSELVGRSNRYATDWREDVGEIQLRGATDTTPATDQKFASSNQDQDMECLKSFIWSRQFFFHFFVTSNWDFLHWISR